MILRRIAQHVRQQNWTAIGIDFLIVVVGVFLGIQLGNWNAAQADERRGQAYAERLLADLRRDRDSRQLLVDYYDAVHASVERTVALLDDPAADPPALVVHAYRATEYSYYPKLRATWDEVVSAGHIGLLPPAVGETVSDYFASDPAGDVLAELKDSPYRLRVRSVLPHAVQDAIRISASTSARSHAARYDSVTAIDEWPSAFEVVETLVPFWRSGWRRRRRGRPGAGGCGGRTSRRGWPMGRRRLLQAAGSRRATSSADGGLKSRSQRRGVSMTAPINCSAMRPRDAP